MDNDHELHTFPVLINEYPGVLIGDTLALCQNLEELNFNMRGFAEI